MKAGMAKKILAAALALAMAVPAMPAWAAGLQEGYVRGAARASVPQPYYEFTFDGEVKDGTVENEGTKTGITATISGEGAGLGVEEDAQRGNKVLNLPGGGLNKGKIGRASCRERVSA